MRDLSSDESSGIQNTGKFLGLTETGTTTASGIPTGLDHMKDLGITHVHLLPIYDYASVDETQSGKPQFNWGYDPENYNVPEGSYSTDPYNGAVRVAEMKQMVKVLHDNQISVIMDVVYNHVYNASDFCVNQIVPGYFSRVNEDGTYSNGSDCGNDTASERSMVRKYIVDSVKYWADEYHIDGFRFDLVGLIDTETINEVVTEVHKTHPDVIFYGEGWTMDTAVTKDGYKMTTQPNSTDVPGFAFFSDTLRDALKGHVFYTTRKGYVSGAADLADTVKGCFLGQAGDWCTTPAQSINYASCHDNMTLLDRITRSTPGVSEEDRIRMNNLSAAIYMTAQGIPFLQAGEEMLRTKIDASGGAVFFASGVFYYFPTQQVRELVRGMADAFPGGVLVFDAANRTAVKMIAKTWLKTAKIKDVGAYFAVSDAKSELSPWDSRLQVSSRGYMLGYSDLKDPSVSGFFRFLARIGDNGMKMQIVKIGFGGKQ